MPGNSPGTCCGSTPLTPFGHDTASLAMITAFALLVLTYFLLWTMTRLAFAPVVALRL
jgi:hypothetical protein